MAKPALSAPWSPEPVANGGSAARGRRPQRPRSLRSTRLASASAASRDARSKGLIAVDRPSRVPSVERHGVLLNVVSGGFAATLLSPVKVRDTPEHGHGPGRAAEPDRLGGGLPGDPVPLHVRVHVHV